MDRIEGEEKKGIHADHMFQVACPRVFPLSQPLDSVSRSPFDILGTVRELLSIDPLNISHLSYQVTTYLFSRRLDSYSWSG